MGANDKNLKIIKSLFGGDAGKQNGFFRELFEVVILERDIKKHNDLELLKPIEEQNLISLNNTQQAEIDKRLTNAKLLNKVICETLNVQPLEEMIDIPEETVNIPLE